LFRCKATKQKTNLWFVGKKPALLFANISTLFKYKQSNRGLFRATGI